MTREANVPRRFGVAPGGEGALVARYAAWRSRLTLSVRFMIDPGRVEALAAIGARSEAASLAPRPPSWRLAHRSCA
jgi:hypothetical protein